LLYTSDADFSCFADLALTSPGSYYHQGQGSLMQLVLTPGDPFIKQSNEAIAQHVLKQVHELFPSSRELNVTWSNVVKLAQSLYREAPGMDLCRPPQKTPVANFSSQVAIHNRTTSIAWREQPFLDGKLPRRFWKMLSN
jgi:zeta-carotene desaturase